MYGINLFNFWGNFGGDWFRVDLLKQLLTTLSRCFLGIFHPLPYHTCEFFSLHYKWLTSLLIGRLLDRSFLFRIFARFRLSFLARFRFLFSLGFSSLDCLPRTLCLRCALGLLPGRFTLGFINPVVHLNICIISGLYNKVRWKVLNHCLLLGG